MKKMFVFALPLLLVIALGIAGCGESSSGNGGSYTTPDVTMNQDGFDHDSLTVSAGTTVKFIDPSGASMHILCVGENSNCDASASGPAELTSGHTMQVMPGETKQVTFDTPGSYKIACTLHPMMNMTITVQ